jgi:hypothetical protein
MKMFILFLIFHLPGEQGGQYTDVERDQVYPSMLECEQAGERTIEAFNPKNLTEKVSYVCVEQQVNVSLFST